ncbi:nitric oxide reductase activation protein NorD [Billgrantia kenyensis]|uniref:VWA domain-containing protein n=1 Tax=Billgrantia kenyensis TaxID=321266 RepID=A0A7W0AEL7_9GAMM|nr:VWA domain-containing protein [Halomonas kenyensis]MBA2779680.1 VWA domain-containing protein [Halomonas kenyensis]MCG6662635.1 VWA domain-containing protein [Halomonas kenyensis]
MQFLELEEFVGRHWHRWASSAASYQRYPEAAVSMEQMRHVLGVFFRASGGEAGVEVAAIVARSSNHRLSLRQRLGFDDEAIDQARRDEENLLLPPRIDLFPDAELNRDLYFWLVAYLAVAHKPPLQGDPLRDDLARLREAVRARDAALERFPGLAERYRRLSLALLLVRPERKRLPPMELALEQALRVVLGEELELEGWARAIQCAVQDPSLPLDEFKAPRGYRPPLPVPLWGQVVTLGTGAGRDESQEDPHEGETNSAQTVSDGKRKAERKRQDQTERDDPLIANRFEKMLSWTEMVNLNRLVEDNEDEEAKRAAEQMEEIILSPHKQRAATRIKVDLDLPPDEAVGERLRGKHPYHEWNYRKQRYLPDHCLVHTELQSEEGEQWEPDAATQRRIRRVRREFEALRPRRETLRGQYDGTELDMDAVIRSRCDLAATGESSDRLYQATRQQARDLAVSILVDVSLSTDAWLEDRRVLDVAKEALLVLGHGLAGCGDDYSIHCFTSHRRHRVWVNTLKTFDEPMGERVARRVSALKPGHYTRMGPAIRHVAKELSERPNRHRLLLLLTDGKPNDTDYYEGRYGIEDTRRAVLEARQQEVRVFGVTIDSEAHQYVSHLFGRGSYAIINRPEHLSLALPGIYRQIIGH